MMHVTSPVPEAPLHLSRFQPLLNKLLEKDPSQRFQNGQEVIAAIDAVEAGDFDLLSVTSVTSPLRPMVTPSARPNRRLGWKIGIPAVALAGAALAGGYWFLFQPAIIPVQPSVVSTLETPPPIETPVIATSEAPPVETPVIATPPIETSTVNVDTQAQPAEEQEQQRQARLQAEQFFEQAQRAQQDGALRVSLAHIEQGLQSMPEHPGLLSLKQKVLRQQADFERQKEAARLQAEAAEREKAEAARRQDRADEFLTQALEEQRRRAYETSLLHIEQGLQQAPDHQRLLALRQEVRKQLREARTATAVKQPSDDGDSAKITRLLQECETHLRANRLTVGRGGNAADCYNEVLKLDRGNAEALAGIDQIAVRYADLVKSALQDGDTRRARSFLSRMESIDPNYAQLPQLRQQLALAEAPKPTTAPSPKVEASSPTPEPQAPVAPPINLVSIPQVAEQLPATVPDTQVIAQDRHLRLAKTRTNDDVSLQVTTSAQGLLDEAGRAAVKRQVPSDAPARLRIRSDVEDARIWINNRDMGTTPMEIEIPPGAYGVRISREGYTDWNGKVDLAPGEESSITAVLPRKLQVATATPATTPVVTPEPQRPAVKPEPPTRESERRVATIGQQAPNCLSGNCENGRGTYRYPDGSEYSGDFRNARMHGQGTYTYAKRGEKYVGEWRNGVINGQGAYYYRSGNRYEGEWSDGRKNGHGVYLYASRGDRYEGHFANDQPNGQGTYYYSNGDRYEGEWRNGRKHGQGVLYEGGQKIVGEWRNDQKVRVRVAQ
jgi:tetratricopeptide (TPR) repeat protein